MGNLLGLGAKSVCGFFTSKMTAKHQFSDNSPKTVEIKIKMQILLSLPTCTFLLRSKSIMQWFTTFS